MQTMRITTTTDTPTDTTAGTTIGATGAPRPKRIARAVTRSLATGLAAGLAAMLLLAGTGLATARNVEASGAPAPATAVQAVEQVAPSGGSFNGSVTFSDSGFALAVYRGSINDLEVAAGAAGATGVWVQDVSGRFQLLPVRGPVFLQSGFAAAFPAAAGSVAFPQMTAVTLVR